MTEATDLFTACEFRRMPVGPPYYELVCGRLWLRPAPDFRHQVVLGNLLCPLHEHIKRRRLGELVLGPSDVELSAVDVLEPDLYFVSKSRLPILTKPERCSWARSAGRWPAGLGGPPNPLVTPSVRPPNGATPDGGTKSSPGPRRQHAGRVRSHFHCIIPPKQGASAAPDLVVEIFTDKTEDSDRGLKREIYGEHGVRELWLVDKLAEEIAVLRFEDSESEPVAVVSGRQQLTTPQLPGLKLARAEVFEK